MEIKVTVRGLLINISKENMNEIDDLMTVFSSAKRFTFKRLLENKMKKGEIEKLVSKKYGLNIRQSKDAVESARQTIASQKVSVKEYYENYSQKVRIVENQLKKAKSNKKINALTKKLEKRKKKQDFYKNHIDNNTIPKIVFGGRKNFIRRCKGLISNKEWKSLRDNNYYSRGDKTKKGNPNLRIIVKNNMTFLEISTLKKTESNRAVKINVPLYLPQKLSKKTGKINGRNYRQMVLGYLLTGEAYQVELIRKNEKVYCHITIDENKIKEYKEEFNLYNGVIGIDTNPDGLALTRLDKDGNYKWCVYLKEPELLYARSNRRENLCGKLASDVINIAKTEECAIACEDLKFKNDKDTKSKFSRIKHQFIYSKLLLMLQTKATRENVQYFRVKPQFTSKMGLYKYSHQYGLNVHNGAALVIGRRAFGFNEKVPKILKDKLLDEKEIENFNKQTNWKQWSKISNKIKKKGCENPGLWLKHRKLFLNIA
ncbi:IS200/IS605 family accessory protein TnpB-related protein [Clostridium sporogenes]|uniref:IS200/IS605 family accessory protein TnpB-related protein n=1 Tax=Clostridium TaxID=1485 RepID=UPI00214A6F9B|nr:MULTISPECIES: IS200/IS605 family accessory protein TnpB-related protein [Clostridium]MCR1971843.1 IS200/IS605 family accessory protein TnpB-related protein [Clostridium cochlearium]